MKRTVRPVALAPGAITSANLFLGFLAIITSMNENYVWAAVFIILGGFMDLFDGKVARLADTQSKFGGELDSLADLVTFGVAPIILIYQQVLQDFGVFGILVGFMYIICGAFRLARFNLLPPKKEKGNFTGLPIPAGAGLISSFILFTNEIYGEPGFRFSLFILGLIIVTCILMVSTIEYISFPKLSWKTKKNRIVTIIFIVYFLFLAKFPAYIFFPTGVLYLMSGLIGAMIPHPNEHIEEEISEVKV